MRFVGGDERALAAIRRMTREHHGCDDITDDAPVFAWIGIQVKGLGPMTYDVPDAAIARHLEAWPHPHTLIAVWPEESTDDVAPVEDS